MPPITNRNTTQQSMTALGRTGPQLVKLIPAPRVYIAPAGTLLQAAVPMVFSNGVTPNGFTDLGSVLGGAKINYSRKVKEVTTGIDNYFRGAYANGSSAQIDFSLEQLDDVTVETISGLSPTVVTAGSIVNYEIGQLDLNQLALLLVVQNKFDGKEFQFYNPAAYLNFGFEEQADGMALKVTGYLPYFTAAGQTQESIMSVTIFNPLTPIAPPVVDMLFGGSPFGAQPFGQ